MIKKIHRINMFFRAYARHWGLAWADNALSAAGRALEPLARHTL